MAKVKICKSCGIALTDWEIKNYVYICKVCALDEYEHEGFYY